MHPSLPPPIGIRRNPIWTDVLGVRLELFRARASVVTKGDYTRGKERSQSAPPSLTPHTERARERERERALSEEDP